jgi:hypothetical protein
MDRESPKLIAAMPEETLVLPEIGWGEVERFGIPQQPQVEFPANVVYV